MTAPFARGATVGTDREKPKTETLPAAEIRIGDQLFFHDNPVPKEVVGISEERHNGVRVMRVMSDDTAWLTPAVTEVKRLIVTEEEGTESDG